MWEIIIFLGLAFLLPFLGVVAGAHYELWRRKRRTITKPSWTTRVGEHPTDADWRGL
jgi:hypothetical protein